MMRLLENLADTLKKVANDLGFYEFSSHSMEKSCNEIDFLISKLKINFKILPTTLKIKQNFNLTEKLYFQFTKKKTLPKNLIFGL